MLISWLTHSVAKGRLDKAKISRVEFLEQKSSYPPKKLLHHMNLADNRLNFLEREKNPFSLAVLQNWNRTWVFERISKKKKGK